MNGGLITRAAAKALQATLGYTDDDLGAMLRGAEIHVEDQAHVADDKLSPISLYRLTHDHHYYVGVDVSAYDILAKRPWLTFDEADEVAATASEYVGDNDNAGEARSYAIEGALRSVSEDWPNSQVFLVEPEDMESDATFTGTDGRVWTVLHIMVSREDGSKHHETVLRCSDGSLWEDMDSEWHRKEVAVSSTAK